MISEFLSNVAVMEALKGSREGRKVDSKNDKTPFPLFSLIFGICSEAWRERGGQGVSWPVRRWVQFTDIQTSDWQSQNKLVKEGLQKRCQ